MPFGVPNHYTEILVVDLNSEFLHWRFRDAISDMVGIGFEGSIGINSGHNIMSSRSKK